MNGVFPGCPQSFRYQRRPVDECSPGRGGIAQDDPQEAERFMAKWIAAEKVRAGQRHVVGCPNVAGKTKDRIAQSKRTRAGSLTIDDKPPVA